MTSAEEPTDVNFFRELPNTEWEADCRVERVLKRCGGLDPISSLNNKTDGAGNESATSERRGAYTCEQRDKTKDNRL